MQSCVNRAKNSVVKSLVMRRHEAEKCFILTGSSEFGLSSLFFRSGAESPPCRRRLGRRAPLQIFSCCSAALRRTQRPHSDQVLKAAADIILGGSVQGEPPHPAMQTVAFISGGETKVGIGRASEQIRSRSEGWFGSRGFREETAADGRGDVKYTDELLTVPTSPSWKSSITMKLLLSGIVLVLIVETNAQWYKFPAQAFHGARDMWRAYSDMREANYRVEGTDKYFHARGNYDAAQRGPGGKWAAEVISDGREWVQQKMGHHAEDSAADQSSITMKLLLSGIVLVLIVETNAQWYKFPAQAFHGARDMWRAYSDMREANYRVEGTDKYFHARGNYDAAQRGPGGKWAAEVISDGREWVQQKMGHHAEDSAADQSSITMKLLLSGIVLVLIVETNAQWYKFPAQAFHGARDMWRAYSDMREANYRVEGTDKYFHARGNYDAAQRGPGGKWAAEVISDGREWVQQKMGHHAEDSAADQSSITMKLLLSGIVLVLIVETNAQWYKFPAQAFHGARDMWRAYSDMREANYRVEGTDKYFHARGNYDAAQRGPGGKWAAEVISDGREWVQQKMGHHAEDSAADQVANQWGRDGKDPNHFRPAGLPDKY
ncbi:hypothetical protein L3Q82_000340 [Scortum barcoo]|uniref:Uncharacterized protein n=1 Tax=Scortum barcoo TaxID=214431 RepID=A0ACB8X9Z3_9TELE|nr:hypothetical protein L3Q82_000340 [Scortum barcoo]